MADLTALVARLEQRCARQDRALHHAADAIVRLRRGNDALRAHNRELERELHALRRRDTALMDAKG